MNKQHNWLHQEIHDWLTDGLVSRDQAEVLRQRYPLGGSSWGLLILSGFGAVLLGLGVILLFAYNWAEMSKWLKLAIIFSALIATHVTAMAFQGSQTHPRLSEGLHALGTMLFGASIWLVAQIYHIDDHYPNAILVWGLGGLLLAWVMPSLTQALMALVLLLGWQTMETFGFRWSVPPAPLLILLGILPLVLRLNSPLLAVFGASALLISLMLSIFRIEFELIFYCLLLVGGAFTSLRWTLPRVKSLPNGLAIGAGFALPGVIAYLFVLYFLTFPKVYSDILIFQLDKPVEWFYLLLMLTVSLMAWGWAVAVTLDGGNREQKIEMGLMLSGTLLALLLGFGIEDSHGWWAVILFNLLFLGHGLFLISDGVKQVRLGRVIAGCLMLTLLTGARYLDLFDSLISRAMAFLLIGGIFFVAGNFYSRRKNQQADRS